MAQAALKPGMNYKTPRVHAKRLGCFKTNQPGKKSRKRLQSVLLEPIFSGTHASYQRHRLKERLLKEGNKKHCCERCGLAEWQGAPIPLKLPHNDGNRYNHSFSNSILLCLGCHALTDNYRARNIRNLSASAEMQKVEPLKFGETFIE